MGLLFWRRKKTGEEKPKDGPTSTALSSQESKDGAMEVPRPKETAVFEFGSVAAAEDRFTLAGYCPVSNDLEPCRWEVIPSGDSEAPQFRVVF
eukprot:Gb_11749 [translate_table: standard]